ncbi:hypothetical protein [Polyangium jinanense]|uniref:Uncharacterized protein n=1 Tax=Polyangium jinanense TaxID=2829994 RepID=A0A9X3WYL7_9BACT|nr:hypothetical protein [Polyangium jinanense]MDC3952858.1 hypothetical protein [Polyangium jinanense]MDC3980477.1 hypothetical protein [Polyangium jinanense]
MDSRLKDFLTDAALDHDQLMVFLTDPQSAIQSAQLSADDERALRTGNPDIIYARIQGRTYDPNDPLSSSAQAITNYNYPYYPNDTGETV